MLKAADTLLQGWVRIDLTLLLFPLVFFVCLSRSLSLSIYVSVSLVSSCLYLSPRHLSLSLSMSLSFSPFPWLALLTSLGPLELTRAEGRQSGETPHARLAAREFNERDGLFLQDVDLLLLLE